MDTDLERMIESLSVLLPAELQAVEVAARERRIALEQELEAEVAQAVLERESESAADRADREAREARYRDLLADRAAYRTLDYIRKKYGYSSRERVRQLLPQARRSQLVASMIEERLQREGRHHGPEPTK